MTKLEIKPGTAGNQYLYANGHRLIEFDSGTGFEVNKQACTALITGAWGKVSGNIKPESDVQYVLVDSQSERGTKYRLTTIRNNGRRQAVACTCKYFQFHSECKHILNFNNARA